MEGIEWGGDVHVPPGDEARARDVAALTREAGLEAYDEVSALSDASRSLFSALRWVARRRTLGELSTFALPPEVRVLRRIAAAIRTKRAVTPDLRRDWQVFN